ncbi:MAG: hypothetical protein WA775_06020 [Psychroserpens sp.]
MIITKILGLTSAMTKSKKAKMAILVFEIGILAFALYQQREEEKEKQRQLR